MSLVAYDAVAPNVAQVKVEGAQVTVTWKCVASGRTVGESTATMAADASVGNRVKASVKRSVASELIYGAARLIAGALGGAVGRVVSNAAYPAAADLNARAVEGVDYSEASRRAAVVAAFETVRASFAWSEERKGFVAR